MKQINLEKYKTLAERYTKALWDIAEEKNEVEKFGQELSSIIDAISENTDIEGFFVNPVIKIEDKKEILQKSFEGKVDEEIYNFLNLLVDKNRMFLLPNIKHLFNDKIFEKQNVLNVEAQTVIELNDDMRNLLIKKLEKITNKNVKITNKINKDIIGGVILSFDGNVIDGSVQTQLKRLQKQLI